MKQQQIHNGSLFLRYIHATKYAIDRVDNGGDGKRVLSFGCSWGAECAELVLGLPKATVIAADIDPDVVDKCRTLYKDLPNVEAILSDWDAIKARGPYDIIFANSVLCRYPAAKQIDDLTSRFSFTEFADLIGQFDEMLTPGGSLMIYNSNYLLSETDMADRYTSIIMPSSGFMLCDNFVGQFDRNGQKVLQSVLDGLRWGLERRIEPEVTLAQLREWLNQGLFIKAADTQTRADAARRIAQLDEAKRQPGAEIRADLALVYGEYEPHAEGFETIRLEQVITRNTEPPNLFQSSLWAGDDLLLPPRPAA